MALQLGALRDALLDAGASSESAPGNGRVSIRHPGTAGVLWRLLARA